MIGQIILGHVNELLGLNESLSTKRLKICLKCPLYKKEFGGVCNSSLYLDPETNDVSTKYKEGYYKGCGCRLLAKTTLDNAKCPVGKW